jgi:hypothetical protein
MPLPVSDNLGQPIFNFDHTDTDSNRQLTTAALGPQPQPEQVSEMLIAYAQDQLTGMGFALDQEDYANILRGLSKVLTKNTSQGPLGVQANPFGHSIAEPAIDRSQIEQNPFFNRKLYKINLGQYIIHFVKTCAKRFL